jgi:rubrerythrin
MGQFRDALLVRSARGAGRRQVLTGSALAIAAAAAPALLGLDELAAKAGEQGKKGGKKGNNRGGAGDNKILNYALTLEHLEYAFYRDGLDEFTESDFDPGVYARLIEIRDHEDTHVDALIATIEQRGGDPVEEGCYDFGDAFSDPVAFLATAQALENTGVMAYDGAIALIKNPGLQTTGATIATVEARHAAYLNILNDDSPFPAAFDEAKDMEAVLQIAGQFVIDCAP